MTPSERSRSTTFVLKRTFAVGAVPLLIPVAFMLFVVPARHKKAMLDEARERRRMSAKQMAAVRAEGERRQGGDDPGEQQRAAP